MTVVAQLKLQPSPVQQIALTETLERVNAACCWLDEQALETTTYRQFDLHAAFYRQLRSRFTLGSQASIRAIAKVADAFKQRKCRHRFSKHGSIGYDARMLGWVENDISLWTVSGRMRIPFVCGEKQRRLLTHRGSSAQLCRRNNEFYLSVCCTVPASVLNPAEDVLGVDMGVVNLATDSDGTLYAGDRLNDNRRKHRVLRSKLQAKGTKSAKRKLRKLSGKEARFAKDVNHVLSRRIVDLAERTDRAIAIEDLSGIRDRIRARRQQRTVLHSWSFGQLRAFLTYKAELAGVPLLVVDPRNTSRTCPACGHCERANRRSQSQFTCQHCGFSAHADIVGAGNIRALGLDMIRPGRPSTGLLSRTGSV